MTRDRPAELSPPPLPPGQVGLSAAIEYLRQTYGDDPALDAIEASLAQLAPLLRSQADGIRDALSPDALRTLGAQSRILRQALGLTRAQLAAHAGLADSTVRNFETGRHRLTDRCLIPLLRALLHLADGQSLSPPIVEALRGAYQHTAGLPSLASTSDEECHDMKPTTPKATELKQKPDESWGHFVRRRREAVGMPQEELAIRAGVSFTFLKGFESGHVEPTAKQRHNIEGVLREAQRLPRRDPDAGETGPQRDTEAIDRLRRRAQPATHRARSDGDDTP